MKLFCSWKENFQNSSFYHWLKVDEVYLEPFKNYPELLEKIGYGGYDHHTISFSQILDYYRDVPNITDIDRCGQTLWNGRDLLRRKCEYIMEQNLGGIMIWSLDHDAADYEDQLLPVIGEGLGINRD